MTVLEKIIKFLIRLGAPLVGMVKLILKIFKWIFKEIKRIKIPRIT